MCRETHERQTDARQLAQHLPDSGLSSTPPRPAPTTERSFAGAPYPTPVDDRNRFGSPYDFPMADLHKLVADPAAFLHDDDPTVRRLAIAACSTSVTEPLARQIAALLDSDPDDRVRAEAAEALAQAGVAALEPLLAATDDTAGVVREAVATGLGEIEDGAAVEWLMYAAAGDSDKLVREAAVAALGAIGDERALPALLDLVGNAPPQVRRRSVVALSVFDGPEVEAAIKAAKEDRNPMVREAAEMVVGH